MTGTSFSFIPDAPAKIKIGREIEFMREASRHVAEILVELRDLVSPGVSTMELNRYAARAIKERHIVSSFHGYAPGTQPPYPAVLCVSVNEEIVHGIPGLRILKRGDIVGLDFAVSHRGYHGDSAVTISVGKPSANVKKLLQVTRDALYRGIGAARVGNRVSDISAAVQRGAERFGHTVIRCFSGHGIGSRLHEPPWIPNYGPPGRGPRLRAGMVIAIEPLVTRGKPDVEILPDQWTAVTKDGAYCAHFEHTILIRDDGPEILTKSAGSH
jgi:methionyl aminopeptidase